VVDIFTGDDIAADKVGGLICGWMIHSKDGSPMAAGAHPALAQGKVRYVGDHVAVVIAETLAIARDAAEKIKVDYDVLPAVVDMTKARQKDAPEVHEALPRQPGVRLASGRQGGHGQGFCRRQTCDQARYRQQPPDPQRHGAACGVGEYDQGNDALTLYTTSQNPHVVRLVMSAFLGLAPEHKLRVIAPMSAAVSARRSSSTPRKRSASGRRAR
jgi:carbon-monoxide dehydrogenase large subunit